MNKYTTIKEVLILNVIALLLFVPSTQARSRNNPLFEYAAGTQSLPKGCEGKLEITQGALVFNSPAGSISVPYNSISHMEYTEKVSKQIRKMDLNWAVKPTGTHNKHQGYFTVIYSKNGQTHAMILEATPETMQPYLAEIDLKTGLSIHNGRD